MPTQALIGPGARFRSPARGAFQKNSRQTEICGLEALRAGRPPARATTWLSAQADNQGQSTALPYRRDFNRQRLIYTG